MRPVEKKNVGETVSYVNSKNQTITETIQEYYSPYNNAKMPLLGNLGCFCSYCEEPICQMNSQWNILNQKEQMEKRRHGITF